MPDRPEDVDEAFARLVAGFDAPAAAVEGPRPWPDAEDFGADEPVEVADAPEPARIAPPPAASAEADSLETEASWEDEGHFVPPVPPPLPRPAPLRLAAWIGVLVGPVLMTIVAALSWRLPELVTTVLVVGFVGGVVYLIATMGDGPRDPYGPDNGAVV